jgi:Flp pilus assembly protein CpaB
MRLQFARGLDLGGSALIAGGVVLVAAAVVSIVVYVSSTSTPAPVDPAQIAAVASAPGRAAEALPSDKVATVLFVDAGSGAGPAARTGDRIDILGYFSRKTTGDQSVTRLLLQDVPVLSVTRSGTSVALTLAVAHDAALLLQEAQAIGGRPMVTLRAAQSTADVQIATVHFSDTDLTDRIAGTG